MRSPRSVGLDAGDQYVRASDVVGAYVAILGARSRYSRFRDNDGQPKREVVFTCELLVEQWNADGEAVPTVFRFSLESSDAREEVVAAFVTDREPIGPFVIVQLPSQTQGQSGAIVFNDASDMMDDEPIQQTAVAPKAPPRAVAAPATRPVAATVQNARSQAPRNGRLGVGTVPHTAADFPGRVKADKLGPERRPANFAVNAYGDVLDEELPF